MTAPGLLLILILISLPLFLTWLARGGRALNLEREATVRRATPLKARVLEATDVSPAKDSKRGPRLIKLSLELPLEHSLAGAESRTAQATWRVRPVVLPEVQPGQEISVRVDRQNPEKIYPDVEGAWHAWELETLPG